MKKYFIGLLIVFIATLTTSSFLFAQKNKSSKKYPALLWEISGNGMKKKSYLYGTMHVSKKLVFNLSDSFFYALKSVDKVGLELNPDNWQTDMIKAENEKNDLYKYTSTVYRSTLSSGSVELEKYESNLQTLLKVQPSVINNLLYRNYNKYNEDYEEDTFLDLYIYQAGKKLGKRATGMEKLKVSDIMQIESYNNELREKKKAKDIGNTSKLNEKIEEAYRNQDLDALDSLEKVIQQSDAYIKHFLHDRNVIQANSMDTIIKNGFSLFVGVGSAHLPGENGVIELLRKKGYKLRPIKMIERDAKQKEEIEKMRCPISFKNYSSEDGMYQVAMPGKPYDMGGSRYLDTKQYSDMANGSYYVIARLRTHANFIGDDEKSVLNKMDSLLYENIPGKIISKKKITNNGYDGFAITNKTRRGDIQRYQIFVLPNEAIVFKMSGPNDYILNGSEADSFFNSIKLLPKPNQANYQIITPKNAGFSITMPHQPICYYNQSTKDGIDRWEYETVDFTNKNSFGLWLSNRYNFYDIKDDSTELELMNISIYQSEPIQYMVNKKFANISNYNTSQCCYKLTDSSYLFSRNIIRGPHYYTLMFHSSSHDEIAANKYFNSLNFLPFEYRANLKINDAITHFECSSPLQPKVDTMFRRAYSDLAYAKNNFVNGVEKENYWQAKQYFKLTNDTTGETVLIQSQKLPIYFYAKDLNKFWQHEIGNYYDSTTHILKQKDYFKLGDGTTGYNIAYTDTGSTKLVKVKISLKSNYLVYSFTVVPINEPESQLTSTVLGTVQPYVSKPYENILNNKLELYFKDFYSKNESTKNKARQWISNLRYDEEGIPMLVKAFKSYKYDEKDFYENKIKLLAEFGYITDSTAQPKLIKSLKELYESTNDSSIFQNQIFFALARLRNKTAYTELKQMLLNDPPVFESNQQMNEMFNLINDSLKTAKILLPEVLQLASLDDYKPYINSLLENLIDSNLIKADDYESYSAKLLFDGRIELKKQFSKDEEMLKQRNDKDAQEANRYSRYYNDENVNKDLLLYIKLLAPFYSKNLGAKKFFDKALKSQNNILVINAIAELAKYKITINDTLIKKLACNKMYSFLLNRRLGQNHAESIYPNEFKNQKQLTISQIYWEGDFKLIDTIVFLQMQKASIKKNTGNVYVYKYRLDSDGPWYIALSGIQPNDLSKINFNSLISDVKTQIDPIKPLQKQIDKAIAKEILMQMKNMNSYFGSRSGTNNYNY
ncbi:MAG: hypothetical protein RL065_4 [Bacteroidota bacterium]